MADQETIFVTIPSYRDSECQHTVIDLLAKATFSNRVYIGICFQHDEEQDKRCFEFMPKEPFPGQIKITHVPHKDATGPCWARHLAQKLYSQQKYFFSLDSHMRFVQGWDELLIGLLKLCPSEKPIITTYPPGYELPNKLQENPKAIMTCAKELGADGMLRFVGKELKQNSPKPLPASFWVSGFSFSSAKVLEEVPYDPHLPFLFFGEESSMTARLWTSGWDFYAPGITILYHLWERTHRPSFRENQDPSKIELRSRSRVKYILGIIDKVEDEEALIEIERYGLGKSRTLKEYQEMSGVDFASGKITDKAKYGGLPKEYFLDNIFNMIMLLAQQNLAK